MRLGADGTRMFLAICIEIIIAILIAYQKYVREKLEWAILWLRQ